MEQNDTLTLILTGDNYLACKEVEPTAEGVAVTELDGNIRSLRISYIEQSVRGNPDIDGQKLRTLATRQHSEIALLLLHLAHAWKLFQKSPALKRQKNSTVRVALFGSASLALTVLPENTSHDADIAVPQTFAPFLSHYLKNEKSLQKLGIQPELTGWAIFAHLPHWEMRACRIRNLPVQCLVPHPLDTVSQKLLRINEDAFERDHRHIREIMRLLDPPAEQMLGLFVEGASRFSDISPKQRAAARANTIWFLKEFYPAADLEKDVLGPAIAAREKNLQELGAIIAPIPVTCIKPLPDIDWKQTPGVRL